jgi:hypothetical protein
MRILKKSKRIMYVFENYEITFLEICEVFRKTSTHHILDEIKLSLISENA